MTAVSVERKLISTERLGVSYLTGGNPENQPLLLVHGNVSSNLFWDETIQTLSRNYWVLAPDLRGYGETESKPIDATRGVRDWSDDLKSFVEALNIRTPIHMIGWSLGGGIVMQYAIDHSPDVKSLVLINPISPFGFGGTKDVTGTPCYSNFAGSGGGTANPQFVDLLKTGDRGSEHPNSPRNVLNQFYFKPPFRVSSEREEQFVSSMLKTKIGKGFYPGGFETCEEWPGVAPGENGINNAMSPKYLNLSSFAEIGTKCPVLWIRGANDLIVSDQSFFDFGYLGSLGYVPDWPGDQVYPPQPMVSQTRHVLEQYQLNGGKFEEFVMEETGHSPQIENHEMFSDKVLSFLQSV
ncbi:alpha/beta hydrolase [Effusibacillus lacus]|uniref:Alpha/beta hydrolase n=1 Tax=Effusibacillus lacus TaxID=1348429 RepID=A0A292YLG4_9BACL|nr:alpha/beta hydrolase [Effusibacillus lacus]TCS70960.1 pimeloyl-ACP methyl ester carboxylesterase [Effusibacillus lacus]GAX90006.1 alpha/beta hydrolase [Effusibacillus lacus]